jgi:sarcosine oxidase subunit beta
MTISYNNRTVIIGGGIQGCSTAYFLSKRGQSVTLVEKDRIGRHASGVNAGGVRRLGRDFAEIPLSLAAADIWQNLGDEIGDAANGFHSCFYIKVAIDEEGRELGLERADKLKNAGYKHEIWIDADEVKSRLPNISALSLGGLLVEHDGWALPWLIVHGFANAAKSHGAEIVERCSVLNLSRKDDIWQIDTNHGVFEAENVVNCSGAWAARIAELAGDPLPPIHAFAPMLAVTDRHSRILPAVMGVLGHTLSLKQLDTGQFVIGGGVRASANLSANKATLALPELAESMKLVVKLFPELTNSNVVRCWSGIEGYMPDNLPVIGRGQQDGLFHGFGFSAHGFQLGPAVGEALADLVMGQQPRVSLEAFNASRFCKK